MRCGEARRGNSSDWAEQKMVRRKVRRKKKEKEEKRKGILDSIR
jgi:hypothetical protein